MKKGEQTVKNPKKLLSSALLVIMVILSALPASALDYRTGANGPSESYLSGKYHKNLEAIPLTGDGAVDVIAVALSQLGYAEGGSLSELDGATPSILNYTEYNYNMGNFGIGYGGAEYHWCASFVSFCLYQSGCHDFGDFFDCARFHDGDADYIWREISCEYWVRALRGAGRFHASFCYGGAYTPGSGDLIFFTRDKKTASHIGIVLYSENGYVYTVEGNTSSASVLETNGGGVYAKSYKLTNPGILGFGKLPYKTVSEVERPDYSGRNPGAGYYISKGVKYLYLDPAATVRADISLPKYTMFRVSRVASGKGLGAVLECEYGGRTYYIKNNTDRIYQLTCEKEEPAALPSETAAAPPETALPKLTETKDPQKETAEPETSAPQEDTAAPEETKAAEETAAPVEPIVEPTFQEDAETIEKAEENAPEPESGSAVVYAISSITFTGALISTACLDDKEKQ